MKNENKNVECREKKEKKTSFIFYKWPLYWLSFSFSLSFFNLFICLRLLSSLSVFFNSTPCFLHNIYFDGMSLATFILTISTCFSARCFTLHLFRSSLVITYRSERWCSFSMSLRFLRYASYFLISWIGESKKVYHLVYIVIYDGFDSWNLGFESLAVFDMLVLEDVKIKSSWQIFDKYLILRFLKRRHLDVTSLNI